MRIATVYLFAFALIALSACAVFNKKTKANASTQNPVSLQGSWVLNFIPYAAAPFDSLYKNQKPTIQFDLEKKKFNGFTGCNGYNGALIVKNDSISFKEDILMTMKACIGKGESVYLEYLKRVNKFSVSPDGNTLDFIQGDVALMRFARIEEKK